jgi:G:T/U-mismatch repair DNA glycosylase
VKINTQSLQKINLNNMPINEQEQHPFLGNGESIQSNKMIVGTFPVFSLTLPITNRKTQLQLQNGDITFFYGSIANHFWSWYLQFIDNTVVVNNVASILTSLTSKRIAISDVIRKCSRINVSSKDNDLRVIEWNMNLSNKIDKDIFKIICTSKGAMNWLVGNILIPSGFTIDINESKQLHNQIIGAIPNSNNNVNPVAKVLYRKGKKLNLVSLPSPGSPYRRLDCFGRNNNYQTAEIFLQQYIGITFDWFLN